MTYRELLHSISSLTTEQLNQEVQICQSGPDSSKVIALKPAVILATVGFLELEYARSSIDNKHNKDEVVILIDGNPFGEDGAIYYDLTEESEKKVYPKDYCDAMNWTGPAQKLRDEESNSKGRIAGAIVALNRMANCK